MALTYILNVLDKNQTGSLYLHSKVFDQRQCNLLTFNMQCIT